MAAIDVGYSGGINTYQTYFSYTTITKYNAANDTGKITSVLINFNAEGNNGANVKVGTFYGSGVSFTVRDYATIGTVTKGSDQTFTGLDIDVSTDDYIGVYYTDGFISIGTGATDTRIRYNGDAFATGGAITYTAFGDYYVYVSGIGTTSGWTGKIWGVTNPAKIWGIPVANIAKVGGI